MLTKMPLFHRIAVLAMTVVLTVSMRTAAAEERIALVIGNGSYQTLGALTNPTSDAMLMATTLKELGFEVIANTDLDQEGMKRAIKTFGRRLDEARADAVGLFFYAGHGVQTNGTNFLLPIGAEIERESDLDIEAVELDWVLAQMEFASNQLNFLIIDACRNNPMVRSFRSGTRGLAPVDAPRGTLIAYATEPGGIAADGNGTNSPYTTALVKNLRQPGRAAEEVFRQVRIDVLESTNQAQVPWESSSLTGAFYFNPDDNNAATEVASLETSAKVSANGPRQESSGQRTSEADRQAVELTFWQSIEDSPDPALFDEYLSEYPDGEFSGLAVLKRDQLHRDGKVLAAPSVFEIEPLDLTFYAQKRVNIRAQPSSKAERLTTVDAGIAMHVTGEVVDQGWYRVALAGNRQAFVWKPLLDVAAPTVPAVETAAVVMAEIAAPDASQPNNDLSGRWQGKYRCHQDVVGLTVDITEEADNQLSAVAEFYPLPGTPSFPRGSYAMVGEVRLGEDIVWLSGTEWIERPFGLQQHDLEGRLQPDGREMIGRILTTGCTDFVLWRN